MALGPKVVDLIGLHLLNDADQVGAVGEIAVMKRADLDEVINPGGVENARPEFDAMNLVPLL